MNSYENRVARVSETLSICSRILLIVAASLRPWTALADGKWMGKAKMRSLHAERKRSILYGYTVVEQKGSQWIRRSEPKPEKESSQTLWRAKKGEPGPNPSGPWMMPQQQSSFQTADATDFSEQVPRGSSSIKVALVIMRNLWAQVLESRGIYLCLGVG